MSNFPSQLDDDVSLPRVDDNITEEGQAAINASRDAIFAIEGEIGIGASGTAGSIANRLGVSLNAAGNIKASALTGLGLVTLPITNTQISATAAIAESKLALDHSTASLFSIINNLNTGLDTSLAFITNHGSKLEPHLIGVTYRHVMNHIDIDSNVNNYFKNRYNLLRDNSNLYNLFKDINKDLVAHEKADSTFFGSTDPTSPSVGTVPPNNYAHVGSGIYINTTNFSFIPQTATDIQQIVQFIDNSNIFILGTRIQTLYANGISRTSRSTILSDTSHGQLVVPITTAIAYHLDGGSSSPVDNIDNGDDVIEFSPSNTVTSNNVFDSQFASVRVGDIITINYGAVIVSFIIKETKYISTGTKRYVVRIDGKNLLATASATAQINRPLFNREKYGVLSLAQAQPPTPISGSLPSLVVGAPRGAEILGNGFSPELLDSTHYNLYLVIYPSGNPADGSFNLATIDVTGNKGTTPGAYTLDSVINSLNAVFRTPGYNYRFIAYSYQGNLGIMLADSYSGTSFSIVSGIVATGGAYDPSLTATVYPFNVVNVIDGIDPLGFGINGSNVASPPYSSSFANPLVSQLPTKIFIPLTRKTFYVNGVERERLNVEPNQNIDSNGDGFWPAFISGKQVIGSRVRVSYQVNRDLSTSGLKIGKTIVVQSESGSGTQVDFGRFFIENIQFNSCNCDGYSSFTTITVYDGVHGTGVTPYASSPINTNLRLYFSGDSVGFSTENLNDTSALTIFKRHFEAFINQDGYTFTQERGRMNISGSTQTVNGIPLYGSVELTGINIYGISPKLRGYLFSSVRKINLQITSYVQATGVFSGYLCAWDGSTVTHQGPVTVGKKGQPVRFYDETNVDYIDFIFNSADAIPAISSTKNIDIQLYPTLSLDDEVMLLGTCQINDLTKQLSYVRDARQFGNVSEVQLTTSALDYIAAPTRLLRENGIIRGFDVTQIPTGSNPYPDTLFINGGTAVVNGKIINMNNGSVAIPVVQEITSSTPNNTITWFVCVNDRAEFELVASTDFDPLGGSASLYTGLDHTRLFTVQNPNIGSPTAYYIRGSYLSDIVQNQKDIAIIGIITTTISVVSSVYVITSATFSDARRFVYNGYGGLDNPLILGDNASFRSFAAVNAWLLQLTKFKSASLKANNVGKKVIVKGNVNITSTIALNYVEEVTFEGDAGIFTITVDNGFTINSNVRFKNLKIDYAYDPIANSFFNTSFLANPGKAAFFCSVSSNTGSKNITFENCLFTTANQYHFSFIGFLFPTAAGCYAENINIINNKFQSTYAGEDKQAVVSFVGPTVTPGQDTGARLINCNISHNDCNKNQMIMVSGSLDSGSNTVLDLLVGVNLKISNNICGAISVLVKKDVPTNITNISFSLDKSNSTIISNNVCKFIYSGFSNGRMITDSANATPNVRAVSKLANGIFSGSMIIENNTSSFIHTGIRTPTSYTPNNSMIIIKNNHLIAYDSSAPTGFLNDYYVGYISPTYTQTSTALIVDKVVGS